MCKPRGPQASRDRPLSMYGLPAEKMYRTLQEPLCNIQKLEHVGLEECRDRKTVLDDFLVPLKLTRLSAFDIDYCHFSQRLPPSVGDRRPA
jgi:hypothetical protein